MLKSETYSPVTEKLTSHQHKTHPGNLKYRSPGASDCYGNNDTQLPTPQDRRYDHIPAP